METLHSDSHTLTGTRARDPGDILLPTQLHWERGSRPCVWASLDPCTPSGSQAPVVREGPFSLPPPPPHIPALKVQSTAPSCRVLSWRFVAQSVPAVLTCLVFFLPKFLMYMSYSFTGGRSKKENVNEKSRSMSRSNFVLRVLENKLETDKLN